MLKINYLVEQIKFKFNYLIITYKNIKIIN